VCGQPVYCFGWHVDLWDTGANKNAVWHSACVVAWQFWTAPSDHARLLRRLQARRCGESGGRLWKSAEVDHRIPLFRVWSEYRIGVGFGVGAELSGVEVAAIIIDTSCRDVGECGDRTVAAPYPG
jgi:hypothetical protein